MTALTDRQRVELGLPAHLMLDLLLAGAEVREAPAPPVAAEENLPESETFAYRQQAYESFGICRRHLQEAMLGVTADLPTAARLKILRRTERLYCKLVNPYVTTDAAIGKVALIGFYLLQILVDQGWIVVGEDSDLSKALDILLPGLEPLAQIERVDASAQKQARHVFQMLQCEGYYRQ